MCLRGNDQERKLSPLWHTTPATSSRFLIESISNTTNTLWFGSTVQEYGLATSTKAARWNSQVQKLSLDLQATIIDSSTVKLTWANTSGSTYQIHRRNGVGTFVAIDTTTSSMYELSGIIPGEVEVIFVRILTTASPDLQDVSSDTLSTQTYRTSKPLAAKQHGRITNSVDVQFTGPVGTQPIEPTQFTLLKSGVAIAKAVTVLPLTNSSVVCSFSDHDIQDGVYQIECLPIPDGKGGLTQRGLLQFVVERSQRDSEMIITRLQNVSEQSVELEFSEAVLQTSVDVAKFSLSPSGEIKSVVVIDTNLVRVEFSEKNAPTARGITYSVTARNILSNAGIPITSGSGNTASFVLSEQNTELAFVYPQPASLAEVSEVTIGGLPLSATVEIIDQRFKVIAVLSETDGNGGTVWNLNTSAGERVSPGLYYFRVVKRKLIQLIKR